MPDSTREIIRRNVAGLSTWRQLCTIARFHEGSKKYGPKNHLKPDFSCNEEAAEEVMDCRNIAGIAESRDMRGLPAWPGWKREAVLTLTGALLEVIDAPNDEPMPEECADVVAAIAETTQE